MKQNSVQLTFKASMDLVKGAGSVFKKLGSDKKRDSEADDSLKSKFDYQMSNNSEVGSLRLNNHPRGSDSQ